MRPNVYFVPVEDADKIDDVNAKLSRLLAESRVLDFIGKDGRVAVKLHFGEAGTSGYVRPPHLRLICDEINRKGAVPFLSDANTLYRGERLNAKDHLAVANRHGFTEEAMGAKIFIPDEEIEAHLLEVPIDRKHVKTAKIGRCYAEADGLLAVAHFKGHALTGFGGTIKNIGMGCATRAGKLAQHCDATPSFYEEKCVGCGECENICPVEAIYLDNDKAVLRRDRCIGCASCVAACPNQALFIDLDAGDEVQEKMAEYTYAVLKDKKEKSGFINFALRVNKECDCWTLDNERIAPDVGIFASSDPVAVDKASLDLVNASCGKEIFRAVHPAHNPLVQLEYAQQIGLGRLEYELIRI